jgi:hypothetical protein
MHTRLGFTYSPASLPVRRRLTYWNISMATRSTCRTIVAALFLCFSAHAAATEYAGRGVFNFVSDSGCPLGDAAAGARACDRLALTDADTHAAVDTAARTIRLVNTRNYDDRTPVGDVLLQGSGVAADGQRVPLSLHLKLSRDDMKWQVSMHAHAPVKGEFTDIRLDPYRVMVNGAKGEETVLTPEQAISVLAKPSLYARVAQGLVQVRNAAPQPGAADIIVSVGVGKAAKQLARVRFQSQLGGAASIPAQLDQGTWSLDLQALSSLIPRRVVQGDLFLFQLENETLLQPLREKGFDKNGTLTLGARDGKGYLRYNGVQQDFPAAAQAARLFMEDSFLGLILTRQQHPIVANAK